MGVDLVPHPRGEGHKLIREGVHLPEPVPQVADLLDGIVDVVHQGHVVRLEASVKPKKRPCRPLVPCQTPGSFQTPQGTHQVGCLRETSSGNDPFWGSLSLMLGAHI